MIRPRLRSWTRDRRGVVALEFALLAPFMMFLLFGLFEVASLVRISFKLSHAAETLAKVVSQQVNDPTSGYAVTTSSLSDYCKGSGYELAPFPSGKLAAAIVSVTAVTSGSGSSQTTAPAQDWEDDSACPTTASSYGSTAVSLAGSGASGYSLTPSSGNSAIIVRATYSYTPLMHYLLGSSWTLTQTAFSPARQGSTVKCSGC